MTSAICTLYEGNYHLGVAALINSVSKHGFKGSIYVGIRGASPQWYDKAEIDSSLGWEGAKTLVVNPDLKIHFLPVSVSYQLTNYKPIFVLELFAGPCRDTDRIAYFDPDIVIKCDWQFFETWMSHGVALVHEISNNDMPVSHPIRREWEKVASQLNKTNPRKLTSYINAGFFGVSKDQIEFLEIFRDVIDVAIKHYKFEASKFQLMGDRSDIFYGKDQDALNIAAMFCECPISEMGPEAMDFISGGFTMSHAVGSPKPWAKSFISFALKGVPPSMAEKFYWNNVEGPIKIYSAKKIKKTIRSIKIASAIGRFYKRG
jgi:hypothetical protein